MMPPHSLSPGSQRNSCPGMLIGDRHRRARLPQVLQLLAEDSRLNVYAGEREVRPPGAPTTGANRWTRGGTSMSPHIRSRCMRTDASPLSGTLHLAQAQSNRGAAGRKKDFPDAERLVKRLVAQELTLSFVPDGEQRLWRTVMRRKYQLTCNRTQLQNRLECLLEEAQIKLSSLVSDLLGLSARRMLQALADGETDPETGAALGSCRLHATP